MLDANGQPIPDPTPEAPATPNPAPVTPKPEDTVDYWKQQYNGKNGTAVKLQRQNEALALEKLDLQSRLSEVEVQAQAKVQAAEEARLAAVNQAATATAEAAKYQKVNGVRSVIAKPEYANAAKLLDEEDIALLTKMGDDELTAYLARQEKKLTGFVAGTEADRKLGTPPQAPPAGERQPATADLKQLATSLEEATAKFGFGSKEYQAAYNEHLRGVMASSKPTQ